MGECSASATALRCGVFRCAAQHCDAGLAVSLTARQRPKQRLRQDATLVARLSVCVGAFRSALLCLPWRSSSLSFRFHLTDAPLFRCIAVPLRGWWLRTGCCRAIHSPWIRC